LAPELSFVKRPVDVPQSPLGTIYLEHGRRQNTSGPFPRAHTWCTSADPTGRSKGRRGRPPSLFRQQHRAKCPDHSLSERGTSSVFSAPLSLLEALLEEQRPASSATCVRSHASPKQRNIACHVLT